MAKLLTWDLERPEHRGDLIKAGLDLFGPEKQILLQSSDSLRYTFDNVAEAISFVVYRVKEVDYMGKFIGATIGNIGSSDMYISIHTDAESYSLKMLDSFEYTRKHSQEVYNEQKVIATCCSSPNQELQYMFMDNREHFINEMKNKVNLLKQEVDHHKPHLIEETDVNIHHILNRYFGQSWIRYWFNVTPAGWAGCDVTWNIKLAEGTVITVPITPKAKASVIEKQKKTKVIRKVKK